MNYNEYMTKHPHYKEFVDRMKERPEVEFHQFDNGEESVRVWVMNDRLKDLEVRFAKREEDRSTLVVYMIYNDPAVGWERIVHQGYGESQFLDEIASYMIDFFDKRDRVRRLFLKG